MHRKRRASVIHALRARCRAQRFAETGKWCASALCEKQARKQNLWKVSAWVRLVKSRCASAHYETCVRKCALWPLNLCASVSCGQQVQVRNYKCTLWTELPMLCLIILYLVSNTICINSTWHNNNNNNGTTSVLCGKQARKSTSWKYEKWARKCTSRAWTVARKCILWKVGTQVFFYALHPSWEAGAHSVLCEK